MKKYEYQIEGTHQTPFLPRRPPCFLPECYGVLFGQISFLSHPPLLLNSALLPPNNSFWTCLSVSLSENINNKKIQHLTAT